MKPIVRWAGSKKALIPLLERYWKPGARYIEPFCGSACLFFALEPEAAVLGDINSDLIRTYRSLRLDPLRVEESLRRMPISRQNYYRVRKSSSVELSDAEFAARFLFLNRLCFNGIYRTNKAGEFNVPYGPQKTKPDFSTLPLSAAANLLRRATLVEGDFEKTIDEARCGDFVYLDPPYVTSSRRIFSEYHPDSFETGDLTRFRESLKELNRRGAHFVVSYADTPEGRNLAKDWNYKRVLTRRNVAGFANHRRSAYEVLATNRELL